MQSRRAGRCLGLKQDWQVTRKTRKRPLFFMFSLSCWRALYLSSLQNFSLSWIGSACAEFRLLKRSSATSSCSVTLFTWSLDESVSHGICVPSLKINTTQINEVLIIVTNPDPHADVTMLESTATRSAGCNFKEALDTQVTQRRRTQAGMVGGCWGMLGQWNDLQDGLQEDQLMRETSWCPQGGSKWLAMSAGSGFNLCQSSMLCLEDVPPRWVSGSTGPDKQALA